MCGRVCARLSLPLLFCRNKTGPGDSIFIARAIIGNSQDNTVRITTRENSPKNEITDEDKEKFKADRIKRDEEKKNNKQSSKLNIAKNVLIPDAETSKKEAK